MHSSTSADQLFPAGVIRSYPPEATRDVQAGLVKEDLLAP